MRSNVIRWLPVLAILWAGPFQVAQACDFCNLYLTIQPNDFQNSFGVQHRYRTYRAIVEGAAPSLRTEHGGNHTVNLSTEDVLTEEVFSTYEVWGRFFPKPELQIYVSLPFSQNQLLRDDVLQLETQGIGDLTAIGLYQVHNTICDTVNRFRQRLSLGGGLKLPTGSYKVKDPDSTEIDYQMQPGSGSLDFLVMADYTLRYGRIGANVNTSYKFNTGNNLGFTYANRFNTNLHLFYQQPVGHWLFMPEAGVYFEAAERDVIDQELITGTGGKVLFGSVGGSVFLGRVALSARYQTPWWEDLYDVQIPNFYRFNVGLTYNIPSGNAVN